MWLPCGISMPLSGLLHSFAYHRHHRSQRQVPFVLPHAPSFSLVQEELPLISVHVLPESRTDSELRSADLVFRGFCSSSGGSAECGDDFGSEDDSDDDDADSEVEVNHVDSFADPYEVERVCKVIDELFAFDRNMEAVLDEMGVNLSHDLVIEVLERFRHARKPAFRFFCWAGGKSGCAHDSRTYNSMMTILAKTRQSETMVSLLEEIMGVRGLLTIGTFTIAIKAFDASNERKKAVGIFELMKKRKFRIGVETINCLLDSLGRAKLAKEAQVMFDKLKERFMPSRRTYTVQLNGWCRVKNMMGAARIWNDMIDEGFKPDIVAHNVMVERLFHAMKSSGPFPNVRSYTNMTRGFCKQSKMESAVKYLEEMLDSGLQPDAAVYTCLIMGFGTRKKLDAVYALPDGETYYDALIKIMTGHKMPEHATRIYNKMIQNEIAPWIHTFNMIMKSYFLTRNYEMDRAVWEEMIKKGICPDNNPYTVLIRGLISQGGVVRSM